MSRKPNLCDLFLSEVISYGGLPVTRATAHALTLAATHDGRAADWFAFGRQVKRPPDAVPSLLPTSEN